MSEHNLDGFLELPSDDRRIMTETCQIGAHACYIAPERENRIYC